MNGLIGGTAFGKTKPELKVGGKEILQPTRRNGTLEGRGLPSATVIRM
jgi:hypothetical protein